MNLDWLPAVSATISIPEITTNWKTVLPFLCIRLFFLELIIASPFAYVYVYLFILTCILSISFPPLETYLQESSIFYYNFDQGLSWTCFASLHISFPIFWASLTYTFSFNFLLLLKHIFECIPKKEYMGLKNFESLYKNNRILLWHLMHSRT